MSNVVIDIAAQFTGNKAFKQAETASQKLDRSVAKLGKQLAGVFAVSKVTAYAKASVQAFAADDKAARALAQTLANTGNAFATLGVEQFIADLQRTTGVLDDELRPAFQQLVTVTGNVAKSQQALKLALDVSAATGKSLSAVTAALSKGYAGNTAGLSRLGAGLSKATLKSNDMNKITEELSKKFSGQAAVAAEGYSGQLARLTVASQNAKEIIGKDLLDAMGRIAGNDGIGGATAAIESFATQTGNAITAVSRLLALVNKFPDIKTGIGKALNPFGFTGLGLLSKIGQSSQKAVGQSPGQRAAIDKANIKLQKEKNSLQTIDNQSTAKKIALSGDQLALQQLQKLFDVERIGLQTALTQATDQETRARLQGLMVIKDQDAAQAKLALAALGASGALDAYTKTIMAQVNAINMALQQKIAEILAMRFPSAMTSGGAIYSSNFGDLTSLPSSVYDSVLSPELLAGIGTKAQASGGYQNINISLDGQVFQSAVVNAVNQASVSGTPLNYDQTAMR